MDITRAERKAGLRRMIRMGRQQFHIPENTDYYSAENYRRAEQKFIKMCILEGRCSMRSQRI